MKKWIMLPTLLALSFPAVAENYIVQFHHDPTPKEFNTLKSIGAEIKEVIIDDLNIYQLNTSNVQSLKNLKSFPNIRKIMRDQIVSSRSSTPNDSLYKSLWNLKSNNNSDIQAEGAWRYSTGGVSPTGEEVVVAVVDGGVDIKHEDLVNNIWVNSQEIPGNKIDDDQNGYIDDINGWNAYNSNSEIPLSSHGTHVAGIIGAEGDNKKHVVGINWNTKIMAVAASSSLTSIILKGYGYVLAQKKLWLDSNGKKGANIVATNSSFGVDRADCKTEDYNLWNDIYNAMGEVGILSVAAGPNAAWDVDVVGDVPTGCSSPYIIAVTNTTQENKIYQSAGFGKTTIDLGAPGTDILSTIPNNTTGKKTGTSMATPHVTGAIALLYSHYNETQKKPNEKALYIKNLILSTTTPMDDLQGKTVSGGKLNLQNAIENLQ